MLTNSIERGGVAQRAGGTPARCVRLEELLVAKGDGEVAFEERGLDLLQDGVQVARGQHGVEGALEGAEELLLVGFRLCWAALLGWWGGGILIFTVVGGGACG